jgi:hypothetical protein
MKFGTIINATCVGYLPLLQNIEGYEECKGSQEKGIIFA